MAIITIGTPFNINLEFRTAALPKRIVAWLIDIIVICAYYLLVLRVIYPLFGRSEAISTGAELFALVIPVLLYQLGCELFFNGQTAGKKAVGIKVIDNEGQEPTWGQYATRWLLCIGNLFVYIIPYIIIRSPAAMLVFMVLYIPDFLCVIISSRSQRIGDLAAGTVVIDTQYVSSIHETIYLPLEQNDYQPLFPGVMRLTDRDINGIRNLINTPRPGKDMDQYTQQVANKIKTVLAVESSLPPADFLQQLLKDYNYFTTATGPAVSKSL